MESARKELRKIETKMVWEPVDVNAEKSGKKVIPSKMFQHQLVNLISGNQDKLQAHIDKTGPRPNRIYLVKMSPGKYGSAI